MPTRDELIESHLWLVAIHARATYRRIRGQMSYWDLYSAGSLGLVDAANKFDPARGFQFRTYAGQRIQGSMIDAIRSYTGIRSNRQGEPETLEQREQSLCFDAWQAIFASKANTISMEFADAAERVVDGLIDEKPLPDEQAIQNQRLEWLRRQLARLPEREQTILTLSAAGVTLREIGKQLGLHESRVSQIRSDCLRKLREAATKQ